jgi:hypothetical protein
VSKAVKLQERINQLNWDEQVRVVKEVGTSPYGYEHLGEIFA